VVGLVIRWDAKRLGELTQSRFPKTLVICVSLCTASVGSAWADDLTTQIKELRQLIERLEKRVERLESATGSSREPADVSGRSAVGNSAPNAMPTTPIAPTASAPTIQLLPHQPSGFALLPKLEPTPFPAQGSAASAAEPIPYPALRVSLRDQWRGVHRGMTREQVGSVLGPPTRVLDINSKPLWYYEYTFGAGSVAFTQEGVVEDWQRPPLGLFGLW
jgi:SmpA / OmlA family